MRKRLPPKTENKVKSRQEGESESVPFSQYAHNPIGFCIDILKIKPTTEQELVILSVRDRSITNVKAAHGVGKSLIAACIVLWFVFAVGGVAITTAPTEDQVKQILWAEVRKLYDKHKHKLRGKRGELFVRYSESARAYGFSSRNYDSNSFQGKHGEKLLLIGDEYDGITEIIDDGFRSCLTGSENRGLRIGNPIDPQSTLAKACLKDPHHITISAWSHPNVAWAYEEQYVDPNDPAKGIIHRLKPEIATLIVGEDGRVKERSLWPDHPLLQPEVIPGAISVKWIEDARIDKGENSPFWISRVEGKYPTDNTDGIIPKSWLLEARSRYDADPDYWDELASNFNWVLGLDVADGGDNHALAVLRGPVLYQVTLHPTLGDMLDTVRAAEIAENKMLQLGGESRVVVDNTGVGAGTLGILRKKGWLATGCKFGDGPEEKEQYFNRKAELYWTFRELLREGKIAIAPLGEKEDYIFDDLAATRYFTNTKDQIVCEPKEKTKARLGRSPDSEAAIIALEIPVPKLL